MAQAKKGNARAAANVLREFLDAESTEAVAWVGFAWGEMCGREGDLSDGDVNEALIHASRELAAQSRAARLERDIRSIGDIRHELSRADSVC